MSVEKTAGDDEFPGMEHRQERIMIETERHRIEGVLTLARDGYRSRVSDVLNASERDFITLTDVTVAPIEGGPIELHAYLTLARRHIVFVVAASEPGEGATGV
ncbi:MAG: hypothetical protein JWO23_1956 [Solirubrobacterales bacterium]|jgi:hypothetical protein|nr:hypothetical protein [Solirubrobacterales bacterium]